MTLLEKEIASKMRSALPTPVTLLVPRQKLDAQLLQELGAFLGATNTVTVIRESFLLLASTVLADHGCFLGAVSPDHCLSIMPLLDAQTRRRRRQNVTRRQGDVCLQVQRWQVLVVASALDVPVTTVIELINGVLRATRQRQAIWYQEELS